MRMCVHMCVHVREKGGKREGRWKGRQRECARERAEKREKRGSERARVCVCVWIYIGVCVHACVYVRARVRFQLTRSSWQQKKQFVTVITHEIFDLLFSLFARDIPVNPAEWMIPVITVILWIMLEYASFGYIYIYIYMRIHIHPNTCTCNVYACTGVVERGGGLKRDDQAYDQASMLGHMLNHNCKLKRRGPLKRWSSIWSSVWSCMMYVCMYVVCMYECMYMQEHSVWYQHTSVHTYNIHPYIHASTNTCIKILTNSNIHLYKYCIHLCKYYVHMVFVQKYVRIHARKNVLPNIHHHLTRD